jgi:two-component system, response regulator
VPEQRIILLVEDDADDEALTLRAFEKDNIANTVVVARDGVEACDYLFGTGRYAGRDPNDRPQIVILDLDLQKLNGFEVLAKLRADKRTSTIPVIILTTSKEQSDVARGYDLGANSYIRKPVDFEQFIAAVRQLGLYWLVLNESPPNGAARSGA